MPNCQIFFKSDLSVLKTHFQKKVPSKHCKKAIFFEGKLPNE